MQKTRFKDWLKAPDSDSEKKPETHKQEESKDPATNQAPDSNQKKKGRERSGSQSSERYDPLADSDASSASSDSPPRLTDEVIQKTIRCKLLSAAYRISSSTWSILTIKLI